MQNERIWVLVVEDDVTSRTIVASQLHKKGFDVICAEDGEQAAEIIRYCTPGCILLDLKMPRMHGYSFLTLLREKNQDLPVLVMSAIENQPDLVATVKHAGIQGWIAKPVNPSDVEWKIREVTGSNKKAGEVSAVS